jgi:hypothetical protein
LLFACVESWKLDTFSSVMFLVTFSSHYLILFCLFWLS